jgi:hypothetical protein
MFTVVRVVAIPEVYCIWHIVSSPNFVEQSFMMVPVSISQNFALTLFTVLRDPERQLRL